MAEKLSDMHIQILHDKHGIPVVEEYHGDPAIPVVGSVITGLCEDSQFPTDDEIVLLKSYIQYRARLLTGDSSAITSIGCATQILTKYQDNDVIPHSWAHRLSSWHAASFKPNSTPELCFDCDCPSKGIIKRDPNGAPRAYSVNKDGTLTPAPPWSLEECICDIEANHLAPWLEWRAKYPNGYTLLTHEERYVPAFSESSEFAIKLNTYPPTIKTKMIVIGDNLAEVTERATRIIALTDMCVGVTPQDISSNEIHLRRRKSNSNRWTLKQATWWKKTIEQLFVRRKYICVRAVESYRFMPEVRPNQIIRAVGIRYDDNGLYDLSYSDTYGSSFLGRGLHFSSGGYSLHQESIAPCGDNSILLTMTLQDPRNGDVDKWRKARDWAGLIENHRYPDSPMMVFHNDNIYVGPVERLRPFYDAIAYGEMFQESDSYGLAWSADIDTYIKRTGGQHRHVMIYFDPTYKDLDEYKSFLSQVIQGLEKFGVTLIAKNDWESLPKM